MTRGRAADGRSHQPLMLTDLISVYTPTGQAPKSFMGRIFTLPRKVACKAAAIRRLALCLIGIAQEYEASNTLRLGLLPHVSKF